MRITRAVVQLGMVNRKLMSQGMAELQKAVDDGKHTIRDIHQNTLGVTVGYVDSPLGVIEVELENA